MGRHTLLFCLFFIVLGQYLYALESDNYKFNRIDAEAGISDNEIKCIYKDQTGFLWFGTPSGLNRYDGYEVITYKQDLSEDPNAVFNNDIEHIQQAADGRLFIKTRSGYAIYNTTLERYEKDSGKWFEKYSGTADFGSSTEDLMYIDLGKNLWFVTWDDIRIYDVKNGKQTVLTQGGEGNLNRGLIRDIKQGKNRYWFLFENGILECMEAQTLKVISRDSTLHKTASLKNTRELRMYVDSSGDVWVYGIGVHYGLARYDVSKGTWMNYSTSSSGHRISHNVVASVVEDDKGNIWMGTDHGGVNILDKKTGKIITLWHEKDNRRSISQNTIRCLYKDGSGIIWLGTYKNGVCFYYEGIYRFSNIADKEKIPFPDINCFFETPDKNLWIGTNGGGLIFFDRKSGRYTQHKHIPGNPDSPAGDVIVSITSDKIGRLWIGYYLAGLDCFDGKKFAHYPANYGMDEGLPDNNIWVMEFDNEGHLWAGTLNSGVVLLDVFTGKQLKTLEASGSIYSIIKTKSGDMLVGSQGGLYVYNTANDRLELFENDIFGDVQLNRFDINNLFEDSRGLLWIGTKNGLFIYNPYTKKVRLYNEKNGFAFDLVQSILEDSESNMWIATIRGLTCVKVSTSDDAPGYFYHLVNYDSSEGLQGEWFNYNAAYFTLDSELIFGGSAGFDIFTPVDINNNTDPPQIVITDFQIYNNSIKPGEEYAGRIILKESITLTENITLNYSDNYFSLSFSSLDYRMPHKSKYYYKLEGFNDQWLETDKNSRRVTYTSLDPGKYTLFLKAVNNDGIESTDPVVLNITIRPPFWATAWAWMVYALLLLGGGFFVIRYFVRKSERKLAYAQENMRVSQRLDMDEMKIRFFTNISHEFRTPLTLILSPLDDLIRKDKDPEDREMLAIIRRNAKHLLTLVNQLLDFRKLDMNGATLQESLGDIVQFVKQQVELFAEVMARKDISFSFTTDLKCLYMYFDVEKLSKVLINMLSNAYKFTSETGRITLDLSRPDEGHIHITVTDNGIGIPKEDLDRIFERFYQVKGEGSANYQGSGIGLHISKEFVNLHGGNIHAEQIPEGGTRFVIVLPCHEEAVSEINDVSLPLPENTEKDEEAAFEEEFKTDGRPRILVVEDNKDLRRFLCTFLKKQYAVLQAGDGKDGLEIALREVPDMILSDVMMPVMDGIEMCKAVKGDIRTSHIPVIMLTAKTGEESKLEGLKAGADDYITKPFNHDILEIKIHNLIEAHKRNVSVFKEQIRVEPSKITVSSLDEKLIKKAINYTEANMSNPDFTVEELSRELGMSRVHLYKKLLSLTGKTPIEFIRVIRLKRAAQLLEESQLTISEIAYEVGFNNPKYFRKYFKDEFGVLPSQYGTRNE